MCIFSYEYTLQVRLYSYLSAILWSYVLSLIDASSISLYKNTIHLLFTWNVCVRQMITISRYYKNKLVADKLKKTLVSTVLVRLSIAICIRQLLRNHIMQRSSISNNWGRGHMCLYQKACNNNHMILQI